MGETIRGVVLTGHGGPEMLEWREDLPKPSPKRGEVLVRVRASAVNNTDINTRVGWYSRSGAPGEDGGWTGAPLRFPRIQGIDACGVIEAVGEGAPESRIGERVLVEPCLREAGGEALSSPLFLGSEVDGAFADYLCVASRHAHAVSSPLCDAELASFPCSWSTAENLLTRAHVTAADTVLVTGASGGVGAAAASLAKARGARVLALTSAAKAEALLSLGAARVLLREEGPLGGLGANEADVVIDLVGGKDWPRLLDVLRPGGRLAISGAVAGPLVELDLRTLYLKDLSLFGCTALDDGVFAALVRRIEAGEARPVVAETFSLREIAAAQARFKEGRHVGKIALTVAEE